MLSHSLARSLSLSLSLSDTHTHFLSLNSANSDIWASTPPPPSPSLFTLRHFNSATSEVWASQVGFSFFPATSLSLCSFSLSLSLSIARPQRFGRVRCRLQPQLLVKFPHFGADPRDVRPERSKVQLITGCYTCIYKHILYIHVCLCIYQICTFIYAYICLCVYMCAVNILKTQLTAKG